MLAFDSFTMFSQWILPAGAPVKECGLCWERQKLKVKPKTRTFVGPAKVIKVLLPALDDILDRFAHLSSERGERHDLQQLAGLEEEKEQPFCCCCCSCFCSCF